MGIIENLRKVKQEIDAAATRAGRDPTTVQLVAVTKGISVNSIKELLDAGEYRLGENRVQELSAKQPILPGVAKWHFIGHLQRNKVAKIIGLVTLIHSLDRWSLAEELNRQARKCNIICNALVQVNVAGEASKFGLAPSEVKDFVQEARSLPNIVVKGLMTIAPFTDNPEETRPVFRELRQLAEGIKKSVSEAEMDYLSMGMTNDFAVAIEEGANIIRVGTGIFGTRKQEVKKNG